MALRDQILSGAKKQRLVKLHVPEWDSDVWVPRMTLPDKLSLTKRIGSLDELPEDDQEGRSRWMLRYVIATVCDEAGQPVFSPEDEGTMFDALPATGIERIAFGALSINSMRMEELSHLGKESGEVRNGTSPSGSRATSA